MLLVCNSHVLSVSKYPLTAPEQLCNVQLCTMRPAPSPVLPMQAPGASVLGEEFLWDCVQPISRPPWAVNHRQVTHGWGLSGRMVGLVQGAGMSPAELCHCSTDCTCTGPTGLLLVLHSIGGFENPLLYLK